MRISLLDITPIPSSFQITLTAKQSARPWAGNRSPFLPPAPSSPFPQSSSSSKTGRLERTGRSRLSRGRQIEDNSGVELSTL